MSETALDDRIRFVSLFETILKRVPDESTIQHHLQLLKYQSWADICLGLAESEEARQRGRSITAARPGSILIVMITRDPDAKVREIIELLQRKLQPGDCLTVIDRSGSAVELPAFEYCSVIPKPGATVFQCRAELATLRSDFEWLALVEDHNMPAEGWMDAARLAIAAAGPEVGFLSGAVDNLQSTDFWSWCSYLTTFSKHRPPMQAGPALPGIANVLIRCADLPSGPYRTGQFEVEILPELARGGKAAPRLVVDHIQHVDLAGALGIHTANARIIGAIARRYVDDPFLHLKTTETTFNEHRVFEIEAITRGQATPYPLQEVMDGVRLLLRSSFIGYSLGMICGPGANAFEVD